MHLLVPLLAASSLVSSKQGPLTVTELLGSISQQAGIELRAEGEVARMLVVSSFAQVELDSFKVALATVVDAEWVGDRLVRTRQIEKEYSDRLDAKRQLNKDDLDTFLRVLRGELSAESIPQAFSVASAHLDERCPGVSADMRSWTDDEVARILAGGQRAVTLGGKVAYVVGYSQESGSLTVEDLGSNAPQSAAIGFSIGRPLFDYNQTALGWQRVGRWDSINDLRIAGDLKFVGGENSAEAFSLATSKPCIAVYMPSVRQGSTMGYTACLEQGGWFLVRPHTFDRPGMHSVDERVLPKRRMTGAKGTIDAVVQAWESRPYRYMDSWVTPPDWNPVQVKNFALPLTSLWQGLNGAEKDRAVGGELRYQSLSRAAKSRWINAIAIFVHRVAVSETGIEAKLCDEEALREAVLHIDGTHEVRYRTVDSNGNGYETSWQGLNSPGGFAKSDETVFGVYDVVKLTYTVTFSNGEKATSRAEATSFLGSVKYADLAITSPERHPDLAVRNMGE